MSKENRIAAGVLSLILMTTVLLAKPASTEDQSAYNLADLPLSKIVLDQTVDPALYPVAAGDIFALNIIMTPPQYFFLTVSPTGDLLVPGVGIAAVADQTLSEALEKIYSLCRERYPRAEIYATLQQPRSFKVILQPAGQEPVVAVANPLTRVMEVYLEYLMLQRGNRAMAQTTEIAGATETEKQTSLPFAELQQDTDLPALVDDLINPSFPLDEELNLSLRRVVIHRQEEALTCDLLKTHMLQDEQQNPYLLDGDIIEIPTLVSSYRVGGGVNIPGIYEWAPGCTIAEAVSIAGGLKPNAVVSSFTLHRFTDETTDRTQEYPTVDAEQIQVQPDDFIQFAERSDFHVRHYIEISGEVAFPGVYSIEQGVTTVSQILQTAGGLNHRADPQKLVIIPRQRDFESQRLEGIPFTDLSDSEKSYLRSRLKAPERLLYLSGSESVEQGLDYPLMNGDQLYVPAEELFIEVIGAVRNPGRYPFVPGLNARDYLDLAGGKSRNATRRVYVLKPETGIKLLAGELNSIQPGDVVFVEEKPEIRSWDRFKDIVTITSGVVTMIAVVISLTK